MRDAIARALSWVLSLLAPRRPGRHSAAFLAEPSAATPEPTPADPWSRPWGGPSAAQVRTIFQPETDAETTMSLSVVQKERHYAVEFAAIGVEYPYSYDGAPFSRWEFNAQGMTA